jgi:putative transposase
MPQRDILAMTRCTGWLRSLMYFAWRQMARDNPTWGQGRIANEPLLMLGLRVLKTPSRCPQANTICGRGLGTRRRDALDFVIPLIANHLRRMRREWVVHDNQDCPHMSLGPGMPQPPVLLPVSLYGSRHRLPTPRRVVTRPILDSLHREYRLKQKSA